MCQNTINRSPLASPLYSSSLSGTLYRTALSELPALPDLYQNSTGPWEECISLRQQTLHLPFYWAQRNQPTLCIKHGITPGAKYIGSHFWKWTRMIARCGAFGLDLYYGQLEFSGIRFPPTLNYIVTHCGTLLGCLQRAGGSSTSYVWHREMEIYWVVSLTSRESLQFTKVWH